MSKDHQSVCAQCAGEVKPMVLWVTTADKVACSWGCASKIATRLLLTGMEVTEVMSSLRGVPYFKVQEPIGQWPAFGKSSFCVISPTGPEK